MNEVVRYHNRLNSLILRDFTDLDLRVFFAIVSRLRGNGLEPVTFSYEYLKRLTNERRHMTQDEYGEVVKQMYRKLLGLRFVYSIKDGNVNVEGEYNLFEGYENDRSNSAFTIRVTPSFAYMFNELQNTFTAFSLDEFVNLPGGIYTKQLYRQLKQWKTLGHATYTLSDLRLLMDIPERYPNSEVTRRVIEPAVNHLRKSVKEFRNLTFSYSRRGKTISKVEFRWDPEPRRKNIISQRRSTSRNSVPSISEVSAAPVEKDVSAETVVSEENDEEFFQSMKSVNTEWLETFFGITTDGEQ